MQAPSSSKKSSGPHQLTTFSSDSLRGSAWWKVETLSGRVSPGEAMATVEDSAQCPRNLFDSSLF